MRFGLVCGICGRTIPPHENFYNLYKGTFEGNIPIKEHVTICWECSKEIDRRLRKERENK